jgi:two-component system KDP operon response regulator KdpE
MSRVLVIDDEAPIRRLLRTGFEVHGHTVIEAENAMIGLRAATINKPDLIILDLNLPDLEGSEVLERIRSWSNVPIIILSVQSGEQEKVRLLRLGADDYVVKPFGIWELLARGEAALRRGLRNGDREPVVRAGRLSIDFLQRLVILDGKRVQLTRKEHALLHVLATHAGLVVTHQQLMKGIWGNRAGNIQYLRILVRKLRQKVELDPTRPLLIVSESGVGYRLDIAPTGAPAGPTELLSDTTYCL